ncbi:MAG: DoxX family membrane protein [Bacteroidales bacterium]|nr:DoxX family membrane protein [Bacteroidales bacterium]
MKVKTYILLFLRVAAGWHFLYEGIIKLLQPEWSSEAYLRGSFGFLSGFFHWLGSDPGMVQVIDFLNVWGMILLGTGLFIGLFIRISAISGILLLLLYYFAYPPFGSPYFGLSPEGHYWIISRNLIEILVLGVVYLFPVREFSIEKFIGFFRKKSEPDNVDDESHDGETNNRREMLKGLATLPFLGGLILGSISRSSSLDPDALSGATIALNKFDISDLNGELPKGKLGNLEISRLILGCNLIGGWSHSRDLHYVGQLFRQYNNEKKIIETLSIAEQAGINLTNMVNQFYPILNKYKAMTGSEMLSICQVHLDMEGGDKMKFIKEAMDMGATSMYIQGAVGDNLVQDGQMDLIQESLEFMRDQGYLAGMGAHSIQVPIACEAAGIKPDYYFKTMHHDKYWSAHPREFREEFSVDRERSLDHNKFHDNIFDVFPEQTVEVFNQIDVPLFGFKVLAGGAIEPEDGFRYAFENGADFICVGMFDFQIVEDVNLVIGILNKDLNRSRPWKA